METGLVSVCLPCYNVASYVPRLLDSLLIQTHKQLEIILINDGSTDETQTVIDSYVPRLKNEGYRVICLFQENSGQSFAINQALKCVRGEFLAWPDSDDWLKADCIEKLVRFLRDHPEVGMVRGYAEKIRESNRQTLGLFEAETDAGHEILNFADMLIRGQTWYTPVTSMIRMNHFLNVNPRREIYTTKNGGQNLQVMLPVAYRYACWQLPEIMGYYLVRSGSHSHKAKSIEEQIAYIKERQNIFLNTITLISELNSVYRDAIIRKDNLECFFLCIEYGARKKARRFLNEMHIGIKFRVLLYFFTWLPKQMYKNENRTIFIFERFAIRIKALLTNRIFSASDCKKSGVLEG